MWVPRIGVHSLANWRWLVYASESFGNHSEVFAEVGENSPWYLFRIGFREDWYCELQATEGLLATSRSCAYRQWVFDCVFKVALDGSLDNRFQEDQNVYYIRFLRSWSELTLKPEPLSRKRSSIEGYQVPGYKFAFSICITCSDSKRLAFNEETQKRLKEAIWIHIVQLFGNSNGWLGFFQPSSRNWKTRMELFSWVISPSTLRRTGFPARTTSWGSYSLHSDIGRTASPTRSLNSSFSRFVWSRIHALCKHFHRLSGNHCTSHCLS